MKRSQQSQTIAEQVLNKYKTSFSYKGWILRVITLSIALFMLLKYMKDQDRKDLENKRPEYQIPAKINR